jgi:Na+-transporting NADH:ubiquinone oxidoreductase subunit NqrD
MIHYTIYSFKYIIKSNIFEFCKNTENVKGLIYINNILLNSATQITYMAPPVKSYIKTLPVVHPRI